VRTPSAICAIAARIEIIEDAVPVASPPADRHGVRSCADVPNVGEYVVGSRRRR
jgi:hypothetical protein